MDNETARPGDQDLDLASFLQLAREHMDALLARYSAAPDKAAAGVVVKLTVRDLSRLDFAREAVVRRCLRALPDDRGHLERFDQARDERLAVLARLDAATEEVRALDVHASAPDSIAQSMAELGSQLARYHSYEAGELVAFLEASLDSRTLQALGRQAWEAAGKGPTHVHPHSGPADERSGLGKLWTAAGDRLRDSESMFGPMDDALGATGRSGPAPEHPLAHHTGG